MTDFKVTKTNSQSFNIKIGPEQKFKINVQTGGVGVPARFSDLVDFESKTSKEKWDYIKSTLENCTRCYACREACPMCYCNLCFVDQNKPVWFNKTTDLPDIIVFHLTRAMHLAGRCVACGACSSVCPMGIDLNLITRKLEKIVNKRYNFTSGLSNKTLPPLMTFNLKDREDFMLEED